MRVHLVDGTYELFRAFYGGPPATTSEGREVGGARTLLRSLLGLLTNEGATHVACAFDHVIESFRNELFAGYKTGEGIDPALFGQFELAEQVSRALGFVTWPMIEFEADDALASAAAICAGDPRVEQVLLCSPDKDLAQCVVGERVVLSDRMRKKVLTETGVNEKFGVPPRAIPDYLALVGDAADGIPGIRGYGAKSAAAVLGAFGSLDAIPADAATWGVPVRGAAKLAAELALQKDAALLYRKLATLRLDVPLGIDVDALEWRGPDLATLEALSTALDDPSGAARVRAATPATRP